MLDITSIQQTCTEDTTIVTSHAFDQMEARGIAMDNITDCIQAGEIIEQYEDDKPYPSCLLLGYTNNKPLHVVASVDSGFLWIITAYWPSLDKWLDDYKTRKVANL